MKNETYTVVATWCDEASGEIATHRDIATGYYEAYLPSGERITAADRYSPGDLGDVWHADDDYGGGYEIDSDEFAAATIRFVGGPRDGEEVS